MYLLKVIYVYVPTVYGFLPEINVFVDMIYIRCLYLHLYVVHPHEILSRLAGIHNTAILLFCTESTQS